jgi:hypothetical protein
VSDKVAGKDGDELLEQGIRALRPWGAVIVLYSGGSKGYMRESPMSVVMIYREVEVSVRERVKPVPEEPEDI